MSTSGAAGEPSEGRIAAIAAAASAGLRDLTLIGSSGLQALIVGHELCRARGHELRIVPGSESVQRVFELTGMSEALPFTDR